MAANLKRYYGSSYYSLFDLRVPRLMQEHIKHSGDFLAWSNTPYAHILANQPPHDYLGLYRSYYFHEVLPEYQYKLVETMTTIPHKWVYDLDWAMNGSDRFNALTVYAGLGLLYVPVKRQENIVHYRLFGQRTDWKINRKINFYVTSRPTGDLFQQELEWYGLDSPKRPDGRPWNILELCTMLLEGKMFVPADALKDASLRMSDKDKEPGIALLYGAAACLLGGDAEMARGLLHQWRSTDNPYMRISPALRVADWFLGLRAGLDGRPFPIEEHDLNRVLMLEAADTGRFLLYYLSLVDDAPDAEAIARCIKNLRIPETDHKCRVLTRELESIKGCLEDSVPIRQLSEGSRILVVRMAPMDMLHSLLGALNGKDVRLSVVVQESIRDTIDAGGMFQGVHTIPDGMFRASKATDALSDTLAATRYDACIVILHWITQPNTNEVLSFIRRIGVLQNYAYMDANQHPKTLFPLDSLLVKVG